MVNTLAIFRNQRPEIFGVEVDVRTVEAHAAENDITDMVLEDGSHVTDHVITRPDTVELTVGVSNYDGPESGSLESVVPGFGVLGAPAEGERAKTAWAALKALRNAREIISVQTHHELYDNMVIESLQAEHRSPFRGALDIIVSLKAVDTAQLSVVRVPEDNVQSTGDTAVSKSASSEVNNGNQAPVTEDTNPSLLARIFG